jgi:hypothetical protein
LSQAEIEERLQPYESTFNDFSEVVIVYGYATLFVIAFPLAPFLCLIRFPLRLRLMLTFRSLICDAHDDGTNNNSVLIEIKLDSNRLLNYARRPLPVGAQSIGEWYSILSIMGLAAVITNCALVIFVAPSGDYISSSTSTKVLLHSHLPSHL